MSKDAQKRRVYHAMRSLWSTVSSRKTLIRTPIFDLEQVAKCRKGQTGSRTYVKLRSAPWVNVIAITPEQRIVLVKQFRHGIDKVTLEIPAGLVAKHESSRQAAIRELREETGYVGTKAILLGKWFPNPAFQSNSCSTWLVQNANQVANPMLDEDEIVEVVTIPLSKLCGFISSGKIRHGLCLTAFLLLSLHWNDFVFRTTGDLNR